jgi:hypothetical protein
MSGGGGGGGGGPSPPSGIDCARLVIRTPLNSPNQSVVAKLKKNDQLSIEVQGARGPVVAKDSSGQIAGSITAQSLLDLIRCINDGYEYIAIVRDVSGGKVDVEIRPKSK